MRYDRGSQNQDLHGRLGTIAACAAGAAHGGNLVGLI